MSIQFIVNMSVCVFCPQAEEERDGMEKVKLDNKRILFNLLPAHVAQHFLLSNPRNMVRFHLQITKNNLKDNMRYQLTSNNVTYF